MRTEKVKLYGTHFFCVLKNTCFSTHMAFGKIPLPPLKSAISLHRQSEINGTISMNDEAIAYGIKRGL